jgi:hypothetical protein
MTETTDENWPPQPDDIALEQATPEVVEELEARSVHPDE